MARWVFIALIAMTAPAFAQLERITSFDSQIAIDRSGEVTVTETITVDAGGKQIRRGIYRDFPTQRGRYWYGPHRVLFEILDVRRDGRQESWRLVPGQYSERLYIGDANRILRPGRYTYTITYKTDRQIGFFPGHDELVWNVTGNFWGFPISLATATVMPPAGTSIAAVEIFTGPIRSTGKDAIINRTPDGGAMVKTTQTLKPGEGLTVSITMPEGSVTPPNQRLRLSYLWRDGAPVWAGLIGLIILVGYYTFVWTAYGKDPESGTIIPRYTPPDGVGPAACRYILNMGWDAKGFTAAIVNLAAKGFVTITEFEEDKYKLTRTSESAKDAKLTPSEMAVALKLFGEKLWTSFVFRSEHHAITENARTSLRRSLKEDFENIYFVENKSLLIGGALISATALSTMAAVNTAGVEMGTFAIVLALLSFALYPLFLGIWTGWRYGEGRVISFSLISAIFIFGSFSLFIEGLDLIATWLASAPLAQIGLILGLIGTNLAFYHLLKAPSHLGRRVMDHIEGFRHYLSVAEQDRMNFHNPPDITPRCSNGTCPLPSLLMWKTNGGPNLTSLSTALEDKRGLAIMSQHGFIVHTEAGRPLRVLHRTLPPPSANRLCHRSLRRAQRGALASAAVDLAAAVSPVGAEAVAAVAAGKNRGLDACSTSEAPYTPPPNGLAFWAENKHGNKNHEPRQSRPRLLGRIRHLHHSAVVAGRKEL